MMLSSWFRQMLHDFGAPDAPSQLTEEQLYFLARLERLAGLKQDNAMWARLNDAGQELLRRAIYSTYCDCVDLGVESEARMVLHPDIRPLDRMDRIAGHER